MEIIIAREMNDDGGSSCLYDAASLRFKFNEVFADIQKLMNKNSDYDCEDVKKNALMLRKVIQDLTLQLNLNQSVGTKPGIPLKQSTPKQNKVVMPLTSDGLERKKVKRYDGTYIQSTPQKRTEMQTPADDYYTAHQGVSTRKFLVTLMNAKFLQIV